MSSSANGFHPHGMMTAVVTPFAADESLDLERLATHIDYLIEKGTTAAVVIAGAGEYLSLSLEERSAVVRASVEAADSRIPVVCGALSPSTREVLEVATYAASVGASALLVLPPYYIRPSAAGIIDHFAWIGRETELPIIVYDNAARTGWSIPPQLLVELAQLPWVVGLKDCARDVALIQRKTLLLGDSFAILSGDDDLAFANLLSGADGAIWATANLAPGLCVALHEACERHDVDTARRLQHVVLDLLEARGGPNHPGPLKEMMSMVGRGAGFARRPLARLTPADAERCCEILSRHHELLELRVRERPSERRLA
jgi:4-hydroxy-tetrahydrodipicolinate synthase